MIPAQLIPSIIVYYSGHHFKDESGTTVETHYYTFPVDAENKFDGYIYFREPGLYLSTD